MKDLRMAAGDRGSWLAFPMASPASIGHDLRLVGVDDLARFSAQNYTHRQVDLAQ